MLAPKQPSPFWVLETPLRISVVVQVEMHKNSAVASATVIFTARHYEIARYALYMALASSCVCLSVCHKLEFTKTVKISSRKHAMQELKNSSFLTPRWNSNRFTPGARNADAMGKNYVSRSVQNSPVHMSYSRISVSIRHDGRRRRRLRWRSNVFNVVNNARSSKFRLS